MGALVDDKDDSALRIGTEKREEPDSKYLHIDIQSFAELQILFRDSMFRREKPMFLARTNKYDLEAEELLDESFEMSHIINFI